MNKQWNYVRLVFEKKVKAASFIIQVTLVTGASTRNIPLWKGLGSIMKEEVNDF